MAKSNFMDFSDLEAFTVELGQVAQKLIPAVRDVVEKTAETVRDDWQDDAKRQNPRGAAKSYPRSIFYQMKLDTDGSIGAEIKPRRGGAGNFGEVLEFAGGGILSAPQESGRKAAKASEADFADGLAKAALGALS
jgi:hypothetical protein